METPRTVGTHALLDFYGVAPDALTDAPALTDCLLRAARAAGMTPLSEPILHTFAGGGLTCFLPLAESHIAIHTYPEWGYLAADIFTCGPAGPETAIQVLCETLHPARQQVRLLIRGEEIAVLD